MMTPLEFWAFWAAYWASLVVVPPARTIIQTAKILTFKRNPSNNGRPS